MGNFKALMESKDQKTLKIAIIACLFPSAHPSRAAVAYHTASIPDDMATTRCCHCCVPRIPRSASNDDENDVEDGRETTKTAKKSFTHAIGNL